MALPITETRSSTSRPAYLWSFGSSSCGRSNMVARPGQTTGPVCVCEEFSKRRERSIPNCLCAPAATSSATSAGNPIRSVATITTGPPDPLSSARARAHSFWRTPVEGWFRLAYPDIQMSHRCDVDARDSRTEPSSKNRCSNAEQEYKSLHWFAFYALKMAGYTFRIAATASSVSRSVYFGLIITPANRLRMSMVRGQHSRP